MRDLFFYAMWALFMMTVPYGIFRLGNCVKELTMAVRQQTAVLADEEDEGDEWKRSSGKTDR